MANQMIALGVRAPQVNPLGPAIAQNAQMINMMRQQDAAERQAAAAAQAAQIAAAKEARDASAAEIELAAKKIDHYTKLAGQTMNPQGYVLLLNQLDKEAPAIAEAFRTNLPPEKFDRNELLKMVGSIGDNFSATYGPRETEVVVDENGDYFVAVTGGFGPQGIIRLNTLEPKGSTPPLAPTTAPAGGLRPTRGANTTPADLKPQMTPVTPERLEAAARAAARGARATDPIFDGLTEDQFRQMQVRADEIRAESGGASLKPASFGGTAQPDLGAVVQQMMQTGVVSQSDFEAMRAAAPGKDAQLAEILRANNIKIMPDEQQPGGFQSAVYRPGEGDASMTQVQSLEGYQDTGRQFRGKSPMQGPLPGSSQVPIRRVREEAEAGRPSEGETYRKGRAEEQAKSDVKFLEGIGAARESAQTALGVINSMIGDARLNKAGQIEIPRGGRAPHPGFEDVVGATWRPGARFIPGTNAADFDAYLEQVEGGAFLEAYERLKGTGQITEVEGQKATRAITRMKRSVSEPEFVKAAREFQGIIQSALDRAAQREAKLKGTAPAGPRRTPVQKGASKELRFNPATGDFE